MQIVQPKLSTSTVLESLQLIPKKYFVWSTHREENVDSDKNLIMLVNTLNSLAEDYPDHKIVFSCHPRTRKMMERHEFLFSANIIICQPFGIIDYYNLQLYSKCVISDSGTITEESSVLGFNSILIRSSTEHPEGIESGNITISNLEWTCLKESIALVTLSKKNVVKDYTDTNFSEKVCKIISGYTSIVNKFIWNK